MQKKKGRLARILIPILALAVIAGVLLAINPIRSMTAIGSMSPLKTQVVNDNVIAIDNGYVNMYLYKYGDKYVLFDAGVDNEATVAALDDLGIIRSDIVAVFFTHTDNDHVAALSLLPDADVYMAASNKVFLETGTGRTRSSSFLGMDRDARTLADGEGMSISGLEVRCIFTPGHTDGSACYVVDGRYLFTGDTLKLEEGSVTLFYDVFNMDNDTQEQSIRKLAGLKGIEAVFTMHNGYTTDFNTAFEGWFD